MAKRKNDWQDTDKVLGMFGEKAGPARRAYRAFVEKGITHGKRSDLTGGGLVRSAGGWAAVKALKRAKIFGNYSGCQVHGSRFTVGYFALFIFFEIVDESTSNLEPPALARQKMENALQRKTRPALVRQKPENVTERKTRSGPGSGPG